MDKSNIKDFSLDKLSSDKNNVEISNKRGDNTNKKLEDYNRNIQLRDKKRNFKLVWKDDIKSCFQSIKRYNILAIKKKDGIIKN